MPASYHAINYSLRPAKTAQRKMILEACGYVRPLLAPNSFRYIGLGSPFFNDFSAFHRQYGMTNMICIEQELGDRDRFYFNRPYDCIDIQWGTSNEILPTLPWENTPTIIWMDYDGTMGADILSDIGTIFANIHPFGIVLVSIQVKGSFPDRQARDLAQLRESLGDAVPASAAARDMTGKRYQRLIRTIVHNEIHKVLSQRNANASAAETACYKQLFNFAYQDGAPMTTIGGIVHLGSHSASVQGCGFDHIGFVRTQHDPFEVSVPILTHKEQRKLDSLLPSGNLEEMTDILPNDYVDKYRSIYRYYPTFAESEI